MATSKTTRAILFDKIEIEVILAMPCWILVMSNMEDIVH